MTSRCYLSRFAPRLVRPLLTTNPTFSSPVPSDLLALPLLPTAPSPPHRLSNRSAKQRVSAPPIWRASAALLKEKVASEVRWVGLDFEVRGSSAQKGGGIAVPGHFRSFLLQTSTLSGSYFHPQIIIIFAFVLVSHSATPLF